MRYRNKVIWLVLLLHIRANLVMMLARDYVSFHADRSTLVMSVANNVQKLSANSFSHMQTVFHTCKSYFIHANHNSFMQTVFHTCKPYFIHANLILYMNTLFHICITVFHTCKPLFHSCKQYFTHANRISYMQTLFHICK